MRACLVIVALACGCAGREYPCAKPYAPSVVAGRPFLWEVRGAHGGTVTFFGTYHTATGDDVPAAAWAALDRATVFVAETDEVADAERARIEALLVLPPGVFLDQLLGSQAFDRLASILDIPSRQLRRMKPWVAMMLLTKQAHDMPERNISVALLARVREHELRTDFLETFDEQVAFLDASAGTIKLEHAVDAYPKTMACSMTRRLEAYRAGDDVYFTSDVPDGGDPIVARLDRWHQRIERYLVGGEHAFVAIGTATLLGPYGLLARFEASGYSVRRL